MADPVELEVDVLDPVADLVDVFVPVDDFVMVLVPVEVPVGEKLGVATEVPDTDGVSVFWGPSCTENGDVERTTTNKPAPT